MTQTENIETSQDIELSGPEPITREIPRRKYIFFGFFGDALLILFDVLLYIQLFNTHIGFVTLYVSLIIFGLFFVIWGCSECRRIKNQNIRLKNSPYGFDFEKELSSYNIIGNEDCKKSDDIPFYKNYIEWKTHICNKYNYLSLNENFYRFLKREQRYYSSYVDIIKTVLAPIEISLVASLFSDNNNPADVLGCIVGNIVVLFLLVVEISKAENAASFIDDSLEILHSKQLDSTNSIAN